MDADGSYVKQKLRKTGTTIVGVSYKVGQIDDFIFLHTFYERME